MTWTLETSQGFESDKIAAFVVPYTRGVGLDLGCGMRKVWPHAIGLDSGHHFGKGAADIVCDIDRLPMFADGSMDFVFSSHVLEHVHLKDVPTVLREWTRVIKVGGYLVLYLPSGNFYPKCGEDGANPDHKWDIFPGDVDQLLSESTDCGWTQFENEERSGGDEYSLFLVFQKRDDGLWENKAFVRNPGGKKRCLVIRYGAIGDQLMVSSILPLLKKEGYYITYNTTPDAAKIVSEDPNIDEFLLQDKDQVPNQELGPYWDSLKTRYDRFINLCESVEGQLLAIPGRMTHSYSTETRKRLYDNINYLEMTHDIAAVPHKFAPKFFPTAEEVAWAKEFKAKLGGKVVLWAINGSSCHKVYPWSQIVTAWLAERGIHVILTGDPKQGVQFQEAIIEAIDKTNIDRKFVHPAAGKWSIRQTLAFALIADCVVGPETGVLNAVSHDEAVPKVVYLSHSSPNNLTKHWKNVTVLTPDKLVVPCYPCHRLHYDWTHCAQDKDTNAALCASAIKPEQIMAAVLRGLGEKKRKAA